MIPRVPLVRVVKSSHGTLGLIYLPKLKLFTFEEEDQANRPNISRIPAGVYRCKRRRYNKGDYDTWEVTGVPGRSLILLHAANTEEDLNGCIAPGLAIGVMDRIDEEGGRNAPKLCVTSSKRAHEMLMKETAGWEEWDLEIIDEAA
jgi:hypothetical protein